MTNLLLALTFISIIAAIVAIMKANRLGDMYDKLSANLRMSQYTGDNFIMGTNKQINDIKNNLIEESRIAKLEDRYQTLANNINVVRNGYRETCGSLEAYMKASFENVGTDVDALDSKIKESLKISEDTKAKCLQIADRLNRLDRSLGDDFISINTNIARLEEYLGIELVTVPGKEFYAKRKKKK